MTSEPLAIEFANTRYAVRGKEKEGIGTPEHLTSWLKKSIAGPDPKIGEAEVAAFLILRDAIRSLVRAATEGDALPARDVDVLNESAAAAPRWPVLTADATGCSITEKTARDDADATRAAIARDAIAILGGPLRDDVRACHAPGCVLFFVKDHPRREWCSAACGNRARAARHYGKQKGRV